MVEDAFATKLSYLKFYALGAPFQKYFSALAASKALPSGKVRLTEDTTIYFSSKADRTVVIFSMNFKEKFDQVIAEVFLNVFQSNSPCYKCYMFLDYG